MQATAGAPEAQPPGTMVASAEHTFSTLSFEGGSWGIYAPSPISHWDWLLLEDIHSSASPKIRGKKPQGRAVQSWAFWKGDGRWGTKESK